ncbi:MAG: hypothetical protein ACFB16_07505 [Phormidesmis sp.]
MLQAIRQQTIVKTGGIIELVSTDLPVGASVEVIVVVSDSQEAVEAVDEDEQWTDFYENVVGAWEGNQEISQIFEQIERERHSDRSGETPFLQDRDSFS